MKRRRLVVGLCIVLVFLFMIGGAAADQLRAYTVSSTKYRVNMTGQVRSTNCLWPRKDEAFFKAYLWGNDAGAVDKATAMSKGFYAVCFTESTNGSTTSDGIEYVYEYGSQGNSLVRTGYTRKVKDLYYAKIKLYTDFQCRKQLFSYAYMD